MSQTHAGPASTPTPDVRRGLDVESIKQAFLNHIAFTQAEVPFFETKWDLWNALAMVVRDRLVERWIATRRAYNEHWETKRIYYLSMEFLIGRQLGNSLINLGFYDECYQALLDLGYDLEEIRDIEEEAGLGNGGLGRLAACFLDSMATLELPGYGYGIRYDYGMFHQRIHDGFQIEEPDDWLRLGNPWEIARPEDTFRIQFYGRTEHYVDEAGHHRRRWVDSKDILAVPYDMPVPGYRNNTVNTLRLFSTQATNEFDLEYFNHGNYMQACEERFHAEMITKVLYPKDDSAQGRELRLRQEYLLVSASLQDIFYRHRRQYNDWASLPEHAAIQLNDTHPALAVAEMMRLLIDHEMLSWDEAWDITVSTLAYTNHTVMPEAMETWRTRLLGALLPRHLEIIYEINRRFLDEVATKHGGDDAGRLARMSIVDGGHEPKIRMAHLAIVGSHSVNGVSELHTEILKNRVLRDFYEFYPDRFNAKTNGVTPRRWLKKCNAPLSFLIDDTIGDRWVTDLDELKKLVPHADDASFQERWRQVKQINKEHLASFVEREQGIRLDPKMMFDCQIKRFHDYKRQLMNILHVITLYNRLKSGADFPFVPRTFIIAGKAAPGYMHAKLTIKLANSVAAMINADKDVNDRLNLAFLANYGVSLAERIIPAAELSEQISTAGMEASGTGNMKFALNGAVTIGTLDGANVEIREEVGDDNIFIFGLTAEEVEARKAANYSPWTIYHANEELRQAIDQINTGFFEPDSPDLFHPLIDRLLHEGDPYMVLADYESYVACQEKVAALYQDEAAWTRMSIINSANMGRFSSDRTIRDYAREIWKSEPVHVSL